jgi:hypothetical protein
MTALLLPIMFGFAVAMLSYVLLYLVALAIFGLLQLIERWYNARRAS